MAETTTGNYWKVRCDRYVITCLAGRINRSVEIDLFPLSDQYRLSPLRPMEKVVPAKCRRMSMIQSKEANRIRYLLVTIGLKRILADFDQGK